MLIHTYANKSTDRNKNITEVQNPVESDYLHGYHGFGVDVEHRHRLWLSSSFVNGDATILLGGPVQWRPLGAVSDDLNEEREGERATIHQTEGKRTRQ
jgi:hypothetical protein